MSINALGVSDPFDTDAQAGTATIPIGVATHAVVAGSLNDTNVVASLASVPITSINASALGSVNITTTVPNVGITGLTHTVVGTPETNHLVVTAAAGALSVMASNATVSAQFVGLTTIPNLTVGVGSTHDMSQYIVDPLVRITDSQVLNINPTFATYSHATKLLTGVSVGSLPGLQLEVTF